MPKLEAMLASSVLSVVSQQIGATIRGQIRLQWDFSKDLNKMKMALESVEAVLRDAERRSIQDAAVRLWLKRLKDAMYAISDMLDEFEAGNKSSGWKFAVMIPGIPIGPRFSMANKMKKMREELENITNQHQSFRFTTDISSIVQSFSDERETDSYLNDQTLIVGRMDEKTRILDLLYESSMEGVTILPIYGIGGIGKTTLAKLVFNDTLFNDYSQVWIYVSQIFNLHKIGNSIISQLSKGESHISEKQMMRTRLAELLAAANKKIMIVLDDLWEENEIQLEELKGMLTVGQAGKVIVIVTTRDEAIAKKICTVYPYKLAPLEDEMCWDIIKQKCAFEARDDRDHVEPIGRNIAMKCGGIALAAQALGYMLKPLTFGEWESVKNSDVWNAPAFEDEPSPQRNVLACLLLSYKSMPPHLKLCFAYCAIFPKGHKIVKNDLIHQWIAHDFVAPSSIFSTRQLCESYVKQLLGLSFLQHAKSFSTNVVHGRDVSLFTMHDLVHDLARFVMADELLEPGKAGNIQGSSCRYAVLTDCSKPLNLSVVSPSKIRALHFQGCSSIVLHSVAFSLAKYMRVLDLSACLILKLPDSIGELRQLRYLNAPRVQNQMFPMSVTNLSKLSYLNLRGSSITELPELIGEVKCLMYLDLSFCQKINELPYLFVVLTQLYHLDLSNCPGLKIIPELLARLTELVHLDLSECSYLQGTGEVFGGLTKLQYLNLSQRFSGVENLVGLQEGISNLAELRYLGLSGSMASIFRNRLTDDMENFIDSISDLPNLEHLNLSRNSIITFIPECIAKLRKLHTLDLSDCDNLGSIPGSIASMNSLKILNVKGCDQLNGPKIFRSNSFALLPHFVVHAADDGSSSNIGLLRQAYPDELKITRLELVKSAEEAQSINLTKKLRIEKLKFDWTTDAQRSVEDILVLRQLVPPSTLKVLEIQGYNSKRFPSWFMAIANYLPNIVKIEMVDMPKCNILPPLGQLKSLEKLAIRGMDGITKIDEGFSGGNARAFPRLKVFELSCMESLEEWDTMYSYGQGGVKEFMFPNLKELTISECPRLKLKPHPPRAKNWIIQNSDNVMSSWGERGHMGALFFAPGTNLQVVSCNVPLNQWRLLHHLLGLTHLKIEHCSDLSSSPQIVKDLFTLQSLHLIHYLGGNCQPKLPEWLGALMNLQMLVIDGYPELEAPVGIVEKLNCLQSLRLLHCETMTTLPEWLGGLTSLKHLEITDCPALISLQESMQKLTTLHSLTLKNCDSLLSPLEWLGSLFALEELNILDCTGIKSFPESIENLIKLKELQISGCPKLKQWCESERITWKLARIKGKCISE
ncbi:unnamed protein product [Urochloa decumbens]|uniref:Uncharacterized protein n=2 Tax=Urochloa decumbens TaxID=240449 RepID=A0ABC9AXV7_9POAL